MELHRRDQAPTTTPPEATFTGDVRISGYHRRPAPSLLVGATVTFAPRARTPWKINPFGQTIIVLDGAGTAVAGGGEAIALRAGDVVWFAPDEPHWEGAGPDETLTYVALQEEHDGAVRFVAAVTDEEYGTAWASSGAVP